MSDERVRKQQARETNELLKELIDETRACRMALRDLLAHQVKVNERDAQVKEFMDALLNPRDPHQVDPETLQYVNPDVGPK